jgi:hypothetical protein
LGIEAMTRGGRKIHWTRGSENNLKVERLQCFVVGLALGITEASAKMPIE